MASSSGSTSVPTPNKPHQRRPQGPNRSRNTFSWNQRNNNFQPHRPNAGSLGSYFPQVYDRSNFHDHQQSLPIIPQPRSCEDLHTERTYLLNSLQAQNAYATDLLRRIPPLEERLPRLGYDGKARRQTKKQISWFRRCLDETNRQEQAILGRLGQLSFEIQSRERWNRIENERRQSEFQQQQDLDYQMAFYQGLQQMHLDPSTPEFYPQEYTNSQNRWTNISIVPMQLPETLKQVVEGGFNWHGNVLEYTPTQAPREKGEEVSPTETPGSDYVAAGEKKNIVLVPKENVTPCNSVTPPLTSRSASMNFAELSLEISPSTWIQVTKRLSLPTLSGPLKIWEKDPEEEQM